MKFQQFIENLKKLEISKGDVYKLTLESLSIEQISQPFSNQIRDSFYEYEKTNGIISSFKNIVSGSIANFTENKPVTHFKYKQREESSFLENQSSLFKLVDRLKFSYKRIIFFGIGGSNLGPSLMHDIYKNNDIDVLFITGSDPDEYNDLEITKTDALVISSKSFTTLETLTSFNSVSDKKFLDQTFAITANPSKAIEFGISDKNIIEFDSSTGGRFSIWSPINITLCLLMGKSGYEEFLRGGSLMDESCLAEPKTNPAFCLSMQDIVFNNILEAETTLIANYDYKLRNFVNFAQQVEMESNGKNIDSNNKKVNHQTGSIIWGGYGPKSQHSFFQHIFQGTKQMNKYFICSKKEQLNYKQMEAQIESLISGNKDEDNIHKKTNISGLTKIELMDLSPFTIGQLISLWENKTILNSLFWSINAFDQWGVELGKINTQKQL